MTGAAGAAGGAGAAGAARTVERVETAEPAGPADANRDLGSGTVLALGIVAVLSSVLLTSAALGATVLSRHRAAAAADLAALAAADRSLGRAEGEPCRGAATVAQANDAALTSCRVSSDGSVAVEVAVPLPAPWSRFGTARARARAGRPAGPVGRAPPVSRR